jgi:hypothetical protein
MTEHGIFRRFGWTVWQPGKLAQKVAQWQMPDLPAVFLR